MSVLTITAEEAAEEVLEEIYGHEYASADVSPSVNRKFYEAIIRGCKGALTAFSEDEQQDEEEDEP